MMIMQIMKNGLSNRISLTFAFLMLTSVCTFGQMQHKHDSEPQTTKNTISATSKSTAELARVTFEKFAKLNGEWMGSNTKGWTEKVSFKTIAQGFVVVENSFDAHPNETIMTMFYLDNDRLMLTHFCLSKTQPRLVATSFDDNGKTITFTFLDATNLPSRNKGHMDKAVFKFVDKNTFTTQWTWYQNGKESWMEEIKLERIKEK